MNIELRRRTDPLLPRVPPNVNDNGDDRPTALRRRRVIIFKPAKSAMTSGRARRKPWVLEFEPQSGPFIEPLMGWTGSSDPMAHMQLGFASREAAIAYAERQGLAYEVRGPAGAARLRAPEPPPDCAEAPVVAFGSPDAPLTHQSTLPLEVEAAKARRESARPSFYGSVNNAGCDGAEKHECRNECRVRQHAFRQLPRPLGDGRRRDIAENHLHVLR
jgi:hypothetical protein